jgi:hypothetical protein
MGKIYYLKEVNNSARSITKLIYNNAFVVSPVIAQFVLAQKPKAGEK